LKNNITGSNFDGGSPNNAGNSLSILQIKIKRRGKGKGGLEGDRKKRGGDRLWGEA